MKHKSELLQQLEEIERREVEREWQTEKTEFDSVNTMLLEFAVWAETSQPLYYQKLYFKYHNI